MDVKAGTLVQKEVEMFLGIHAAALSKEANGFRGTTIQSLKPIRKGTMIILKLALLPIYGVMAFFVLLLHAVGILDDPYLRKASLPKGMKILPNGLVISEPK